MTYTVLLGDCIEQMRTLPPQSVHTCVTSPPYFGLRDYGHAGQIGLEETPDAFVAKLVEVFREVRRVLRDDGTLWLNLGDSYAGSWGAQGRGGPPSEKSTLSGNGHTGGGPKIKGLSAVQIAAHPQKQRQTGTIRQEGLKPKDLIGVPWRVAFALQADGWYLRQDIIWHKPNPMPESVRDRCTKAHEFIFLLSKGPRYYFDAEAIKEPSTEADRPQRRRAISMARDAGLTQAHFDAIRACGATDAGKSQVTQTGYLKNDPAVQALADEAKAALGGYYREFTFSDAKNRRSVWTVTTKPYKGAHFATFPPDLIEPCVLAGAPFGGTVLDPFGGSGTTAGVAVKHGRKAILCELNPEYAALIPARVIDVAGDTGDLFLRAAE